MRFLLGIGLGALVVIVAGSGAFVSHQEERNTFCVACHVEPEGEFVARLSREDPETVDLAVRHHRLDAARCIDCHRGEGVTGRIGSLAAGARNTLPFLVGLHQDPGKLRGSFPNNFCVKCHQGIFEDRGFPNHVHSNIPTSKLDIRCATCHPSHQIGDEQALFMEAQFVYPVCNTCHQTMHPGISDLIP